MALIRASPGSTLFSYLYLYLLGVYVRGANSSILFNLIFTHLTKNVLLFILIVQELLGRGAEEDGDPGLTHGGRRISV